MLATSLVRLSSSTALVQVRVEEVAVGLRPKDGHQLDQVLHVFNFALLVQLLSIHALTTVVRALNELGYRLEARVVIRVGQ